eukprot:s3267_g5.t1
MTAAATATVTATATAATHWHSCYDCCCWYTVKLLSVSSKVLIARAAGKESIDSVPQLEFEVDPQDEAERRAREDRWSGHRCLPVLNILEVDEGLA